MEYLVLFINYNGVELYKTMVRAGETAEYKGPMPQKPNEKFVGWNKDLTNITDNLIVTAVFEKEKSTVLKLGAISFEKDEKDIRVIENAVITNEDLRRTKETDIDR